MSGYIRLVDVNGEFYPALVSDQGKDIPLSQLPTYNVSSGPSLLDHGAIGREKRRQATSIANTALGKWQLAEPAPSSSSNTDLDFEDFHVEVTDASLIGEVTYADADSWVGSAVSGASGTSGRKQQHLVYVTDPSTAALQLDNPTAPRKKAKRRRWNYDDMINAFRAVRERGMSLRAAASAFNVPESTLRDRVHGRVSLECARPGPSTFFTYTEERRMVEHIMLMARIGYPFTRNQVVEMAGDMTKSVERQAPFKYMNPSQAWFYAFVNRWPELKPYVGPKSQRNIKGSKTITLDKVNDYYNQLERLLTRHEIRDSAQYIWTVDEVCVTCEQQPPKVLPQYVQRAQTISYWSPTVALLGAASAAGDTLPPFLVFRGDKIIPQMMDGAHTGGRFASSLTGWIDGDIFEQWLTSHFLQTVRVRPILLLYDGHLQYFSVRVLDVALRQGVILFPLPPHPAYNHCIETSCLADFKIFFKKYCDRHFERLPDRPITNVNICSKISAAYEKSINAERLAAQFKRSGVCPFDPAIAESLYSQPEYVENVTIPEDEASTSEVLVSSASVSLETSVPLKDSLEKMPLLWPAIQEVQDVNVTVETDDAQEVTYLSDEDYETAVKLQKGDTLTQEEYDSLMASLSAAGTDFTGGGTIEIKKKPTVQPPRKVTLTRSESGNLELVEHGISNDDVRVVEVATSKRKRLEEDSQQSFAAASAAAAVEVVEGLEEEVCGVCGRLEPPQLGDRTSLAIVDWAQCDGCQKWVHLAYCCDDQCVAPDGSFLCPICRRSSEDAQDTPTATEAATENTTEAATENTTETEKTVKQEAEESQKQKSPENETESS